jgi:pimeloyl-ACP methyl ester carboxylesterase
MLRQMRAYSTLPEKTPQVRRFPRCLPNAQVKLFDGLGHNPFWENPAGVADVINVFLKAKTQAVLQRFSHRPT